MSTSNWTGNYKPYEITLRQMIKLVAGLAAPGQVILLELGARPPGYLVSLPRKGQSWSWETGSQAPAVLSLLILLALWD